MENIVPHDFSLNYEEREEKSLSESERAENKKGREIFKGKGRKGQLESI